MSHVLLFLCMVVLSMKDDDVELSVFRGVGGWEWAKEIKPCLIGMIFCAFINNPAIYDSAADAITCGIVLHMICIAPLSGGFLPFIFLGCVLK